MERSTVKSTDRTIGILAYGSLIEDPGFEIKEVMTGTKRGVETPFAVEFARSSQGRRGAPTLVPVETGLRVQAAILLLATSEEDATDRLYRREIHAVGSNRRYRAPANPGPNSVQILRLEGFSEIDIVLYTHIGANILAPTPSVLAQLAIQSARRLDDGTDGISYLLNAKKNGIKTALSEEYEREIKAELSPRSLGEALRIVRALAAVSATEQRTDAGASEGS